MTFLDEIASSVDTEMAAAVASILGTLRVGPMRAPGDGGLAKKRLLVAGFTAAREISDTRLKWSYGSAISGGIQETLFTYQIDTTGGQSAAPVFLLETERSPPLIVGIHVTGLEGRHNIARRFTPAAKRGIETWCKQLDDA